VSDIPLSVIIKGPEAVAAWLQEQAGRDEALTRMMAGHIDAMVARLTDDMRHENLATLTAAIASVLARIYLTKTGGMRGPARDALSEHIDEAFNMLEDMPPEIKQKMEAVAKRVGR
jgi:hypothetical protein